MKDWDDRRDRLTRGLFRAFEAELLDELERRLVEKYGLVPLATRQVARAEAITQAFGRLQPTDAHVPVAPR